MTDLNIHKIYRDYKKVIRKILIVSIFLILHYFFDQTIDLGFYLLILTYFLLSIALFMDNNIPIAEIENGYFYIYSEYDKNDPSRIKLQSINKIERESNKSLLIYHDNSEKLNIKIPKKVCDHIETDLNTIISTT